MNPAKLRHVIFVMAPTFTKDSAGGATKSFYVYGTLRAEKITSGGREFYAAQKINDETQVLFRTRYMDGITADMIVTHNDKDYDILFAADPDGRGRELHISCKING